MHVLATVPLACADVSGALLSVRSVRGVLLAGVPPAAGSSPFAGAIPGTVPLPASPLPPPPPMLPTPPMLPKSNRSIKLVSISRARYIGPDWMVDRNCDF